MKENPTHVDESGFDIGKSIDKSLAVSRTVYYPTLCAECYGKAMAHMLTKPGSFTINATFHKEDSPWWWIAFAIDVALVIFWIFDIRKSYKKIVEEGFEWEDVHD